MQPGRARAIDQQTQRAKCIMSTEQGEPDKKMKCSPSCAHTIYTQYMDERYCEIKKSMVERLGLKKKKQQK